MILLTSTSDKLQIVTSLSGSIRVHVSYVDNTSSAVTPARSNVAYITSATTTDVVASPASSTQRNVRYLSVYNSSTSNTVTIQHTDGTTVIPLWSGTLLASESIVFNDSTFVKYNAAGVVTTAPPTYNSNVQTFSSTGVDTWTKPTAFTPSFVLVKLWGPGGGGGGGANSVSAAAHHGGAGGGGGAHNYFTFNASDIAS